MLFWRFEHCTKYKYEKYIVREKIAVSLIAVSLLNLRIQSGTNAVWATEKTWKMHEEIDALTISNLLSRV